MAFEISGKVIEISPPVQVSEKFRKREFIVESREVSGDNSFVEYIKFQLIQDRCDIIDDSYLHEEVRVLFNIKGNRWEKEGRVSYFTNLDAWRIEKLSGGGNIPPESGPFPGEEMIPPPDQDNDPLPF